MRRLGKLVVIALLIVVVHTAVAVAADPSTAQAGHDPFAAVHAQLDSTADRLVASTQDAIQLGVEATPADQPMEADAAEAEIEQFAEQHWNGRPDGLRQALERVRVLRPALEAQLREEGVPAELAAVVLVESAGQTTALSPRGARGLWQFMPETARRYGLRVDTVRDDRLDLEKSTWAAARYLRDLAGRFQDWRLALAAYNAGAGRVQQAINRAGTADFAALSEKRFLPDETRRYVPAVLAATQLFGKSDELMGVTGKRAQDPGRVFYAHAGSDR